MSKPFDPDEIMGSLGGEVSTIIRKTGLKVLSTVVAATPVKTSHARSNWHVTIGEKSDEELPGKADVAATVAAGAAVIAVYPKNAPPGQLPALHIQNAVPYIERLNDGWSKQAPAGFVEKATDVAVDAVNSDRKQLD